MQNNIIIFIHLLAAVIAIGGSIYSLLIYLPTAEKDQKGRDENSPSYKILDLLAPTVFACLLILVGSGVYFLLVNYTAQTGLKPGYYNLFGIKMIFASGGVFHQHVSSVFTENPNLRSRSQSEKQSTCSCNLEENDRPQSHDFGIDDHNSFPGNLARSLLTSRPAAGAIGRCSKNGQIVDWTFYCRFSSIFYCRVKATFTTCAFLPSA